MTSISGDRRRVWAELLVVGALVVTGCQYIGPEPDSDAIDLPTEPVFRPGERLLDVDPAAAAWADGSVIHLDDREYRIPGWDISSFGVTPYGFVIDGGPDGYAFATPDGQVQRLPDMVPGLGVSMSGEYVGWLSGGTPSTAYLVQTKTGRVIFASQDGLTLTEVEDYSTHASGFVGDTFFWRAEISPGRPDGVNGRTLDRVPYDDSGLEDALFGPIPASVDAHLSEGDGYGSIEVLDGSGRKIDAGFKWLYWMDHVGPPSSDHVLIRAERGNPAEVGSIKPSDGAVLSCRLRAGRCRVLAEVEDVRLVSGASFLI